MDVVTLLLVLASAIVLACARAESAGDLRVLLIPQSLYAGLAVGLWMWRRFRWRGAARIDKQFAAWGGSAILAPILLEVAGRFSGYGEAGELFVLGVLLNFALACAAWSDCQRAKRMAALISGFLVLFAFGISTQASTLMAAAAYGVCGLWWMSEEYWRRIHVKRSTGKVERFWRARLFVLLTVCSLIALTSIILLDQLPSSTYVLHGMLPTSGGSQWSEEYARAGVGDGNAMIAAKEKPQSFGPVQSELLLESDQPTLYDLFNDSYGEPHKPKKLEKVIALASQEMQKNHDKLAISKQSGREFSTLRRHNSQQQQTLRDRESAAVMYVIGQTPLHLALEAYDTLDGHEWRCSNESSSDGSPWLPQPELVKDSEKPWINVAKRSKYPIFTGQRTHALKIINFRSNRVPSPPHLSHLHIDRLDRPDFFGWTEDEMLEMSGRECIPQLTILELRSPGLDLTALREADFTHSTHEQADSHRGAGMGQPAEGMARYMAVPGERRGLLEFGNRWMANVPRGWRQVEALAGGLRREFTHDPGSEQPGAARTSLKSFLRLRRGPDYLFATAAALTLRAHGYPTRFVTGFYVRPERYDRSAGQTTVLPGDVHCWLEVCVDGHTWVTVEPTPGYEPPPELLPWKERCRLLSNSVLTWMGRNVWGLGVCASLVGISWMTRITCYEWILSGFCYLWILLFPTQRILWTARLLEYRAALARQPRPPQATATKWYSRWLPVLEASDAKTLQEFLHLLEHELYAPADVAKHRSRNAAPTERICAKIMTSLTVKRMKILSGALHVDCV